ncbi:MAG: cell division protein FtsA [Fusobacterium sp.]|uniref:cell division protein FtsA n=1 Tax=Fusobacterium sp. TaxID=68766 RepID=UPI0026DCF379|nr:cell division protein FtsA [Fusobacterium sp.]MDO4690987.1 cell division protein FtsA [Fusobacterium sp.]
MKGNEIIKFALDIGNHSIKLLAGEMNSNCDKISILDYVKLKSRGIKKSNIEDPEELYECLKEAIEKISQKLNYQVEKISLSVGGAGIVSATRNVRLSFQEREVLEEDVEELLEQAKKKVLGARDLEYYRILYKEIYNIRVNNAKIVKQPVGMLAKDLQADIHIVYVDESYIEKYIEVINRLGLEVDEIYLSSYVSAKGTLDEESKKMGVAHVDIGYATTDIILLKNYKVLHAKTIPIGEIHYISDMTHMLDLTREDAVEILDKFKRKEIDKDNTIRYGAKKVSLRDIRDIIQARTGDIIEFITSTIEGSGFNGYLAKGIVLTGGAVAIDGVSEQIGVKSGYLVRKELPIEIKGLKNVFYSDAVVTGIFLEDMEKEYRKYVERIAMEEERAKEIQSSGKGENSDEELDDILNEEEKEKKGLWGYIKEFF